MSFECETVLAVVPARGGSKGIPRKNLSDLLGKSLVARAAELVRSIEWLDGAVLSTDDDEIALEAEKHGLAVPFRRPDELSGDSANSIDMWRHAWRESELVYGRKFSASILLEPTSPLRTREDIENTVKAMILGRHSSAITVSRTPAHYTPQKTLEIDDSGLVGFFHEAGSKHSIRQTIPNYYHRNGICYAVTRRVLLDQGEIIGTDCLAVVIDRPVVNIDEPFDLKIAEMLLRDPQG